MDIEEKIRTLDDDTAVRVLTTIAKHHFGASDSEAAPTAEFTQALAKEFHLEQGVEPVSDGDVARHALLLLAREPGMEEIITSLADNPPPRDFMEPVTAIALTAALVVVLKTGVEIERDPDAGWRFHLKSEPLSEDLLKGFVEKLLSRLPTGPF